MRESERERQRETERETERGRMRESERERQRERERVKHRHCREIVFHFAYFSIVYCENIYCLLVPIAYIAY